MKRAWIRNTFHNTRASIRVPKALQNVENDGEVFDALDEDIWREENHRPTRYWASPRRVARRVGNALCGFSDCQCGNMIRYGR